MTKSQRGWFAGTLSIIALWLTFSFIGWRLNGGSLFTSMGTITLIFVGISIVGVIEFAILDWIDRGDD